MLASNRYVDEKLSVSITSLIKPDNPVDAEIPLSFQDWLKYNNSLFTNADDFLYRYQSYLNNWYEVKNLQKPAQENITKSLYTLLINEIVLNFTSTDEKRFLQNLDFKNNRDLAVAVPFFSQKIKDICLYYSTLRDDVKSSAVKYNLKGSVYGTKSLLYNQISKSLETEDLTDLIRTLNLSLSDIRNNMVVDIEELYDLTQNYLDISPNLPASAYDTTSELRKLYFSANQYEINTDLFTSFDSAVVSAITAYPFFAIELGNNNFTVNISPINSTNLEYLKDSDFINTVNTQTLENLNLNVQKSQIEKFIGTDFYYISTNSTGTEFLSGKLISSESQFANYLNKRYPTVAAIPSIEYTKSGKDLGLFFKPDKIGLSNFYSFGINFTIDRLALSGDMVYLFPDPSQLGNVTGLTEEEFNSPVLYTDLSFLNKIDFSNQYKFGDSISGPYFQTLKAYQTREQSLNISLQGLSKYTDSQDFFEGYKRNIWSNKDVFPIIPQNLFPIDNRVEKLYSINKTAVQSKSDIYGNELVLYKNVHPNKTPVDTPTGQGGLKIYYCLNVDGHLFYDPISGYNFNYEEYIPDTKYTGILLKTTDNIPPGSGYYGNGLDSTYDNGAPYFAITGTFVPLVSYRFQPETFCPDEVKVTFNCSIMDGQTFVASSDLVSNQLLPDSPSDQPSYNPTTDALYYSELIDGGVNPYGPGYRANIIYPGEFTYEPPFSAVRPIDGSIFLYNSAAPCGGDIEFSVSYVEKSNYLSYKIPLRNTKVISETNTLSAKRSLYETNFVDYGDLYFRNSNSSLIAPASAALSGMYLKYSEDINFELNNKLINFDLIYDSVVFETENYLIVDKIFLDYVTNRPVDITKNDCYFKRYSNKLLEKFSTTWFTEDDNALLVCRTKLYNELSATNYKIVYPEIYSIDLNNLTYNKIYPQVPDNELTFNYLKMFSLSGLNIEINIVSIDKPLLNYNSETGLYNITWLGKDIANGFYIFKTFFKYINGVITNISNSMFKLIPDVNTINFANASSSSYTTVGIVGTPGQVVDNVFNFN